MTPYRTITLFTEPPPTRTGPSSFVVSFLLHGVGLALLSFGLSRAPRLDDQSLIQRYTVRLLNLQKTEPRMRWAAARGAQPSTTQIARHIPSPGGQPAAAAVPKLLAQLSPARQTLVQPDAPPNLLLPQETPIPLILMWTQQNSPVQKIVPPPPQLATPANLQPTLDSPNREVKLADIKMSETAFPTEAVALPPSTTSPLALHGPEPAKRLPETASKSLGPPTPARVMSLSDLQMQEGTLMIPLANQAAATSTSGPLAPGQQKSTADEGNGSTAGKQNGSGSGQKPGDDGSQEAASGGPAGQSGGKTGADSGADAGSGLGNEPSITRVTLPKDGHFGVVVVGSSLAEEYPETVGMWSGRLAYTVYLHVGVAKNWILQYSLPRVADAAKAQSASRPEAPWPYEIVRPHLAPGDYNSDAIMVHGILNVAGRFEQLAVVFPPSFAQAKFVLGALQQWQFRPATQNGQITPVEVLLIIPEESE